MFAVEYLGSLNSNNSEKEELGTNQNVQVHEPECEAHFGPHVQSELFNNFKIIF